MRKNEELFYLIKSLSKREKTFFLKNAARAGSKYARLFKAIDAQSRYDEDAIREQFAGEEFLKQLHVIKNYLRQHIVGALAQTTTDTPSGVCLTLLAEARFLYEREMLALCQKHIDRGLDCCQQLQMWPEQLRFLDLKRSLVMEQFSGDEREKKLTEVLAHEQDTLRVLQQENQLKQLLTTLYGDLSKPPGEHTQSIVDGKVTPLSLRAATYYHFIRQSWFLVSNDLSASLNEARQAIELWEKHPQLIHENGDTYLTLVLNFVGMFLRERDYSEAENFLNKARLQVKKTTISRRVTMQFYNMELEIYRDSGAVNKGLQRVADIETFLDGHSPVAENYRLLLHYQCAHLLFLGKKLDEALRWLNRILNERFQNPREDILAFAHLLYLLIHYEMGHMNLLRYAVESCRRFLKKKRTLYSYEKIVLNTFSRLSTATPDQHAKIIGRMEETLFEDARVAEKENVLDYLDFLGWAKEKTGTR